MIIRIEVEGLLCSEVSAFVVIKRVLSGFVKIVRVFFMVVVVIKKPVKAIRAPKGPLLEKLVSNAPYQGGTYVYRTKDIYLQ